MQQGCLGPQDRNGSGKHPEWVKAATSETRSGETCLSEIFNSRPMKGGGPNGNVAEPAQPDEVYGLLGPLRASSVATPCPGHAALIPIRLNEYYSLAIPADLFGLWEGLTHPENANVYS